MTTIIEVQERGLRVRMGKQIISISSYIDEGGMYFLNENLKKQYVKDTETETYEVALAQTV